MLDTLVSEIYYHNRLVRWSRIPLPAITSLLLSYNDAWKHDSSRGRISWIWSQCIMRNFAAHLSHNFFSKTESDKVTEMTLNKDTATSGQTTCFLLNPGAANLWKLILHIEQAALRSVCHQHLQFETTRTQGPRSVKGG